MLSLDNGENVFLVLLDLSAAFDTVNHTLPAGTTAEIIWHQRNMYYNGSILIFLKNSEFPKVQFWDLYSTFYKLRHLQKR